MHSKLHYSDSQEELLRACGGQMSRLIDRESALVKAASTGAFSRAEIESHLPDKNHFAVHYIGMGDQERFSFNKNGDGWPGEDLQKRASTFVTHGHYFREHRNRDPKLAIGVIKAAKYDPEMGRVEIIVHGDKKKAEPEYEMAKAGKELSCSMSARVAKDVCSICGNQASSPRSYCTHLKQSMGRWSDEHQKYAYALNPNPTFFDLSNVARPADRIARYLQYRFGPEEGLAKAASSEQPVITGGEWAEFEGVNLPQMDVKFDLRRQSLLTKLAAMEKEIAGGSGNSLDALTQMRSLAGKAFSDPTDFADIDRLRAERTQAAFTKLARARVMLPFPEFCSYVTGLAQAAFTPTRVYKKAAAQLPGVFNDMMGAEGIQAPDDFSAGAMDMMDVGSCSCDPLQPALDRMIEKYHCQSGPVKNRVLGKVDEKSEKPVDDGTDEGGDGEKSAAENSAARRLAHAYGLYKLSALSDMTRFHGEDDFRAVIAVAHNFAAHR